MLNPFNSETVDRIQKCFGIEGVKKLEIEERFQNLLAPSISYTLNPSVELKDYLYATATEPSSFYVPIGTYPTIHTQPTEIAQKGSPKFRSLHSGAHTVTHPRPRVPPVTNAVFPSKFHL